MASLSLKDVSGGQIKNLSCDIQDKEFIAICGNGGSDLVKLVNGEIEQKTGTILIGNRVVNNVSSYKYRDVAYVTSADDFGLNSGSFFRRMTVADNLSKALRERKTPKQVIESRTQEAAAYLGIDHLLDRLPRELPISQQLKVAVAQAIVMEPAVFLWDDIFAHVVQGTRSEWRAFIAKLYRRLETTMLFYTRDFEEALSLGSRVLVLKDGRLQQLDTPQNIYEQPANLYTFTASKRTYPPLVLKGKLSQGSADNLLVQTQIGTMQLPSQQGQNLAQYPSNEVYIGIRAENVHDKDYQPPGITPFLFKATTDHLQFVDGLDYLYFTSGKVKGVAALDPRTSIKSGEKASLVLNIDRAILFDANGQRIVALDSAATAEVYRLVVRRGPQPNRVYELTKDIITLGRDVTNDITINDPEVGRHHTRLVRENDGYTIEDLGSTNGTFLGGQRLTGVRLLRRGDLIGLGETVTLSYMIS